MAPVTKLYQCLCDNCNAPDKSPAYYTSQAINNHRKLFKFGKLSYDKWIATPGEYFQMYFVI